MDLGLGKLKDDQLLELLNQACTELAQRDPGCRAIAQSTITTQAENLKAAREALKKAAKEIRDEYMVELALAVERDVRDAVRRGEIRLIPVDEEAAAILRTATATQEKLKREMQQQAKKGENITIHIAGDTVTVAMGAVRKTGFASADYLDIVTRLLR